jgi:hypothetical protein
LDKEFIETVKFPIKELKVRNRFENTHSIKAFFETIGPVDVDLVLQNVGKTAAIDIDLDVQAEPSRTLLRYRYGLGWGFKGK